MIVEVCSSSLKGVKNASFAGANRIELCSALELGGITPSKGLLEEAVNLKLLDIHPITTPLHPTSFAKTISFSIILISSFVKVKWPARGRING